MCGILQQLFDAGALGLQVIQRMVTARQSLRQPLRGGILHIGEAAAPSGTRRRVLLSATELRASVLAVGDIDASPIRQ